MSTDAIVLVKADHKEIKTLFKQFRQAGDDATAKKGAIVELLTVHTYLDDAVVR